MDPLRGPIYIRFDTEIATQRDSLKGSYQSTTPSVYRLICTPNKFDQYLTGVTTINAVKYGLPQRRVRMYIVGSNHSYADTYLTVSSQCMLDVAIDDYLPTMMLTAPEAVAR